MTEETKATNETSTPRMPPSQALGLAEMVNYAEGSIVSRTLLANEAGTVTLFAFDAGQVLSEHTTPYDALVHVLDGQGAFTVGGMVMDVNAGQALLMPAEVPHAVRATKRFKMSLTMLRSK